MQVWYWIWLAVALKLPVICIGLIIYRVVNDTPDQVVDENEGGSGVTFNQGPRKRGPDDDRTLRVRQSRRGDSGHQESAKRRGVDHALRGE